MAGKNDGYIRFQCKACGKRLKVRDKYEGGTVVPCPRCHASVVVPLANLDAIARRHRPDDEDEEWMGRLDVRPDALRERLGTPDIPFSEADLARPEWKRRMMAQEAPAGGPTLNLPTRAFERIPQLDSLSARIKQIEDECVGDLQRMFRNPDITAEQRARRARELADGRRRDIQRAVEDILAAVRHDLSPLKVSLSRLSRSELKRRETLEAAEEGITLYAQNIYGLDV